MSKLPSKLLYRPLGVFRFLLALLVLFQHSLHSLPAEERVFFYHLEMGVLAVATFFAISGFIVAEANDTFYRGRPVQFMINRLLRLVPPYLAALVLSVIVHGYLYSINQLSPWDVTLEGSPLRPSILISGVLDIVPFFQPRYLTHQDFEFIPFAWTLRVELAFYLFAFATYWALSRPLSAHIKTYIGRATFALAYLLFLLFLCTNGKLPQQLGDIPYFLFGVCAYRLWRERNLMNLLHLAVAVVGMLVVFPMWKQRGAPILALQYPILFALLAVFVALAFVPCSSVRWKKVDKRLGDLSYPLYLNHITVLVLISNLGTKNLGWGIYMVGVVFSVILAAIMYWIVETPLKNIRDRIRGAAIDGAPKTL